MTYPFKDIIPDGFNVGGMRMNVLHVESKRGNSGYGETIYPKNEVVLFEKMEEMTICKDQKVQTFWHEVVHAILGSLGENSLCSDEKFVCKFSSLLNEVMQTASINEPSKDNGSDT